MKPPEGPAERARRSRNTALGLLLGALALLFFAMTLVRFGGTAGP